MSMSLGDASQRGSKSSIAFDGSTDPAGDPG
jgi:hypothetical protein